MPDHMSPLLSSLGGAAFGAAVMYAWIRSLIEDRKATSTKHDLEVERLLSDLRVERENNKEFGQAWIGMAAEFKIHLEHAPQPVLDLNHLVIAQHEATRNKVTEEANETRNIITKS